MVEVTDEMRRIVHKLDTMSGEYVDNVDYLIRSIIELHEQSKPEPVGYAWVKLAPADEATYPTIDQLAMCKPFNGSALLMTLIHDNHPQFSRLFFKDLRGLYKDIYGHSLLATLAHI